MMDIPRRFGIHSQSIFRNLPHRPHPLFHFSTRSTADSLISLSTQPKMQVARITSGLTRQGARLVQSRAYSQAHFSGPPTNRVSFVEKVLHGVAISAGMVAVPIWVMVHLKEYQGGE